jgi:hypothetical protein
VLTGTRPQGRERFWQHFADHDQLSELGLAGSSLATVDDAFDLAKLPALEQLDLDGCLELVGSGRRDANPRARLVALRGCPRLRRLSLGGWFPEPLDDMDGDALMTVARTASLRWLALTDCPGIGPTQYHDLRDAKQLETLVLTGPIEPAALDPLDAIPGLTVVIESPRRGG